LAAFSLAKREDPKRGEEVARGLIFGGAEAAHGLFNVDPRRMNAVAAAAECMDVPNGRRTPAAEDR
jgi:hypothetical protein